jgi:putative ABC transport system permease protein
MWRTTYKNLLAHKLRLAMSGLAIVLGVAFVSGTLIFTDTLSRTFNALFSATSADVNVSRAAAFEQGMAGAGSGTATYVPADLVSRIAEVDGVAAVEGYVQGEGVYILDADGKVLDTGGAPGLGVGWQEERAVSPTTLVGGRAPRGPTEVAIDTDAAEEAGYQVGDSITLLTPGPRVEAEVVGTFRYGDEGGLAGASLTAFDTDTAQQLLTAPGQFHGISIAAADGVSDAASRTASRRWSVRTTTSRRPPNRPTAWQRTCPTACSSSTSSCSCSPACALFVGRSSSSTPSPCSSRSAPRSSRSCGRSVPSGHR